MQKFQSIKGFLFDLDGVITDTSIYHEMAWHQLADQLNIPWQAAFAEQLKGISREASLAVILDSTGKHVDYSEADKVAMATAKNDNYLKLLQQLTPDSIAPGIEAFLVELKQAGYAIGLASASKNAPIVLERLGLSDYFEARVDPATLKNGKPAPEIFERCAALLGLQPTECIGVEDAQSGIEAINAAGAISVGIGSKEVLTKAQICFEQTQDLTLANIRNAFH